MVGNGEHISCSHVCPSVPIMIQTHEFAVSLYVLPIEGVDIVLGLSWLRTLGLVTADFSIPSFSFTHQNQQLTIIGDSTSLSPASFHQFYSTTLDHPHPDISHLLHSYASVFAKPSGLPPTRPHDHHIPLTPNSNPVNVKPYRYPHYQKDIMTQLISDMLTDGIIQPSNSPFSSPVLLIKNKDGTWNFCVDYKALNALTIKDRFPIPTIDELLDELGHAKVFTKLDLQFGYHQIRLYPPDIPKIAFRTFDGHYEFLVMPFGLSNAPSTFQSAMNDLLRPFLRKFVLVFFDDILVYSESFTVHLFHLRSVLQLLSENHYQAKLSKCVFGVQSVAYLGHIEA
uniref:Transposon Ty3-I Gag-Pol polyprotein n=1 Tax=Cajanus cajan TaxID=3821 RepID=A0A151R5X5_CAJCA|nr:Transposon Ty3-I Gag-Pol polyprotein [Cajanus cajan]